MNILPQESPVPEAALRDFSKTLPQNIGQPEKAELKRDYSLVIDKLVQTAYDPTIEIAHRGTAINAICSFVAFARRLDLPQPLSKTVWFNCVNILLDRSNGAKSKPLRSLLLCLTDLLPTFPQDERDEIIDHGISITIRILLGQSDHVEAKPALQILGHFIAKDHVSLQGLCGQAKHLEKFDVRSQGGSSEPAATTQWILTILLKWVSHQDTAIAASQTIRTLVQKSLAHPHMHLTLNEPMWAVPIRSALHANVHDLNNFRSHLLPVLFKMEVSHYLNFLKFLGLDAIMANPASVANFDYAQGVNTTVLFTCLEVGKESGLIVESQDRDLTFHNGTLQVPEKMVARVLEVVSDSTRLAGLGLLISSASIIRPFSPFVLRCLLRNFAHLFMETDVYIRGEVLVHIQRLVDRIKAATGPLHRRVARTKHVHSRVERTSSLFTEKASQQHLLGQHRHFLRVLIKLVTAQLHPAAPYQRHIVGLKSLIILAKSGLDDRLPQVHLSKQSQAKEGPKWPFHEALFRGTVTRLLHDLLLNPFEDVRTFAQTLIVMQTSIPGHGNSMAYSKLTKRAEVLMLSTGRADHADGLSRANAIIFEAAERLRIDTDASRSSRRSMMDNLIVRLEQRLLLAKDNMPLAVRQYPLHGILASLRLILDLPKYYDEIPTDERLDWRMFHSRIIKTLHDVWSTVRDVLCNDAPEGYIPDELDEETKITTKDVLSYCWRALKESSTILRAIASRTRIGDAQDDFLSLADFRDLCRLSFSELVELRHRGAFSAVAQAFTTCCSRASALSRDDILEELLSDTLAAIRARGSATTRRSAGLPSIVVGILSASPTGNMLENTITRLQDEAAVPTQAGIRHGDSLPQVHALNCLRAIFINATLGQHTEPYISTCLALSGKSLTNNVWAIRNCGLMLFRALIDRLLGSADSQNWCEDFLDTPKARISYTDFPELLDIVLELLAPNAAGMSSEQRALESFFPALKLIQRIPPPATVRERIQELVIKLCASPHWHVRDMSARTYAALVPQHERQDSIRKLLLQPTTDQNSSHGKLLCILWLTTFQLKPSELNLGNIKQIREWFQAATFNFETSNRCPHNRALFLDITNLLDIHLLKGRSDVTSTSTSSRSDLARVLQELPGMQKSLALHIFLEYASSAEDADWKHSLHGGQGLLDLLSSLEIHAPDAVLAMFETLIEHAHLIPIQCSRIVAQHLAGLSVYRESCDLHRLGSLRSLLVHLYQKLQEDDFIWHNSFTFDDMKCTFAATCTPPPALVESTVHLWGIRVHQACLLDSSSPASILSSVSDLCGVLQILLQDDQSFDLRIAAARSLDSMPTIWTFDFGKAAHELQTENLKLALTLLVYDMLNDDDEEIRHIAAGIAATALSSSTYRAETMVPLLASQRLLAHMTTQYLHLPRFLVEAVMRTTGMKSHATAAAAFSAAARTDTALFAVEKQNLFVDSVRETILWSQALKHIPIDTMFPSHAATQVTRDLTRWTREALSLIGRHLADESGEDGVLGWASKPDMFVFGMRLWFVIDVAFERRRKLERDSGRLLKSVVNMLDSGRTRDVHPLWLEKLEKVVVRELGYRMRSGVVAKKVNMLSATISDVEAHLKEQV